MTAPEQASLTVASTRQASRTYHAADTTVTALDSVDLDVRSETFTAVMGPSGSGKSTLLQCMAGLDRLTSGQALIGTEDLARLGDRELTRLRRDHVGFVFLRDGRLFREQSSPTRYRPRSAPPSPGRVYASL